MRAIDLAVLASYLDRYLRISEVPDAPNALNGLQVANGGTISRAAAAVDLCEATVQLAAQQGADLLLVHHGLFWGGVAPLTGRARLMAFGPERVRRVGIVTGAAGSMIAQAAALGLDTYITGEGSHHTFFDAEELGLNVFYAGHYATETFGVRALAERLCTEFD